VDAGIPRVSRQTSPLSYCGYPVQELCRRHSFEEVAFLLWHGELPTRDQVMAQNRAERAQRALGPDLARALAGQSLRDHPVETLRAALGLLRAQAPVRHAYPPAAAHAEALRLFAVLPALVAGEQRRRHGLGVVAPRDHLGYAANFLYMTFGRVPEPQVTAAFERSLILCAGDGFGPAALSAHAGVGRFPGLDQAVAAGALDGCGPGGAIETVPEMLDEVSSSGDARSWVEEALVTGRRTPAFGPGPDGGENGDARVPAMRGALGMVAALRGEQRLIETYEALAAAMYEASGLHPNLAYPAAVAYRLIGFDTPVFAPILLTARLPGWTAGQVTAGGVTRPRLAFEDRAARRRAGAR
jgi:citrate synthase